MKNLVIILFILLSFLYLGNIYSQEERLEEYLDFYGGISISINLIPLNKGEDLTEKQIDFIKDKIKYRVTSLVKMPCLIKRESGNAYNILISNFFLKKAELDYEELKKLLEKIIVLEFKLVYPKYGKLAKEAYKKAMGGEIVDGYELIYQVDSGTKYPFLVGEKALLTEKDVKTAKAEKGQYGQPIVTINFTEEGREKFAQITKDNVGKQIAILIDNNIVVAPVVKSPIENGIVMIQGRFTNEAANEIAVILNSPLPVRIKVGKMREVAPKNKVGEES